MDIIKKPLISEKMSIKADKLNQYGFIVDVDSTKNQIKTAVESLYNVHVLSVNTIRCAGKTKYRQTKSGFFVGKTASYKKAIVTLSKGEHIDFYSNI